MRNIKPISPFIMVLCTINVILSMYIREEMAKEQPVPTISVPALDQLIEDSKARESMIMQVILLGQHKEGLHEGEAIDLCPACPTDLRITEL